MSNIQDAFSVEKLALGPDNDVLLVTGISNPTAGAGYEAPVGSLFLYDDSGFSNIFIKTGVGDTDWTAVAKFPSQPGNNGKFLQTDGSNTTWELINKQYVALRAMGI